MTKTLEHAGGCGSLCGQQTSQVFPEHSQPAQFEQFFLFQNMMWIIVSVSMGNKLSN